MESCDIVCYGSNAVERLSLHTINLEVQSIFLVVFFHHPWSFWYCVVVLLHPPVSQVLLWSLAQSGPQLQPVHNQLHPPAPVSCDMERGGCGLCMSGCGQLLGLANLTSSGTGSLNYNFCDVSVCKPHPLPSLSFFPFS